VFTEHKYAGRQPAPRSHALLSQYTQTDIAPAGSGTPLPSRQQPPFHKPPPQASSVPRNGSLC